MNRPFIYAVDFDGTLCENKYPEIGAPNFSLIKKLIEAKKSNNIVILWTCREGEMLTEAIRFCKQYGLEFDYVNENTDGMKRSFGSDPRKIFADVYIDDRAFKPKVSEGTRDSKKESARKEPASCIIF